MFGTFHNNMLGSNALNLKKKKLMAEKLENKKIRQKKNNRKTTLTLALRGSVRMLVYVFVVFLVSVFILLHNSNCMEYPKLNTLTFVTS